MTNLYEAPKTDSRVPEHSSEDVARMIPVMEGHNTQLVAFILLVFTWNFLLSVNLALAAVIFMVFALVVSRGIYKINRGLQQGNLRLVIYIILAFIPFFCYLAILLAYNDAAKALKKTGYRMTFFGARMPQLPNKSAQGQQH